MDEDAKQKLKGYKDVYVGVDGISVGGTRTLSYTEANSLADRHLSYPTSLRGMACAVDVDYLKLCQLRSFHAINPVHDDAADAFLRERGASPHQLPDWMLTTTLRSSVESFIQTEKPLQSPALADWQQNLVDALDPAPVAPPVSFNDLRVFGCGSQRTDLHILVFIIELSFRHRRTNCF
eukprot:TRINITY_DN67070_c0_g1_i1.p1 TRINITY_DN67070_c0_g1~~TRINITY_DN67070_c0_g1_i1.p1  ORF type:complete len:179 (-),score=17.90 TRINITY_DN67070_c0_g1_i1:292-828(-)